MTFFSYLQEKDEPSLVDIMTHSPGRFRPFLQLAADVMEGESELSRQEREMLAAYVSGLNQCDFCYNSHIHFAEALGLNKDVFVPLLEDLDTAPIDDKLRAIFAHARKLTLTPYKMVQSDHDRVIEAGWSEQTIEDAIFVVGVFSLINRVLDGHGVKAPSPEKLQMAASMFVKVGYDPDAQRKAG